MSATTDSPWGSVRTLAIGGTLRARMGPFSIWITRSDSEWQVAHEHAVHDDDVPVEWMIETGKYVPPETAQTARHIFRRTLPELSLKPVLADRPVVIRPHTPFYIPAGNEATVFVSTPLWVRVEVHHPSVMLGEFPIVRPSDTWFGSSTMEGEICYATRTSGRLRLEEVPRRPHRAVTPVLIRNEAPSQLFLERMSIPVPYLAVYADEHGLLWTEALTLVRETETEMAEVKLSDRPPDQALRPIKVGEGRMPPGTGMLIRAFSSIFSRG